MPVPSITRNTHYVPEAALKRWSDNGSHVYVYRLLVSHQGVRPWRRELISRLTRQTDLYTVVAGGRDVDDFEKFITLEFEEPGQNAIAKLLRGSRMIAADWQAIARFVVAQDLRTPSFFIEWLPRLQRTLQQALKSAVQSLEQRHRRVNAEQRSGAVGGEDGASVERSERASDYLRKIFHVTIDRGLPGGKAAIRADVRSPRSAWVPEATVQAWTTFAAEQRDCTSAKLVSELCDLQRSDETDRSSSRTQREATT